jgi:Ca-activated chloride channel family protein
MIVFDASGSMAGNVSQGIATIKPRIDEARHALAAVLPRVTRLRRVGLITYGPGAYNQCNVQLKFEPTPNAAERIMREVDALTAAGRTPLTSAVEEAADVLDYRNKPGVIVLLTDGEETCGRSPCDLGKQLHAAGGTADRPRHQLPYRELLMGGRVERSRHKVPRRREQRLLHHRL